MQENRIKSILIEMDNANLFCADCNEEKTTHVSINNGIIICQKCAEEHKKLGTKISFIREISEKWDDYLMSFIRCGSNARFIQFAKSYKINKLEISQKYKTKAAEYYRAIIRSEVMGYDPPNNISLYNAAEIEENIENYYPEFENYSFVKHVDLDTLEKNIKKKKEEDKIKNEDDSMFGKVFKMLGNGIDLAKEKYNENKDIVGNIVAEKSENIFSGFKSWFGGDNNVNNNENNSQ